MGNTETKYVRDPEMDEELSQLKDNLSGLEEMQSKLSKDNAEKTRLLQQMSDERSQLLREAREMRKEAQRPKKEFDEIVQKARSIVQKCKDNKKKVYVLLGSQGAGKSSICKFMFGIEEAEPLPGETHGTKELVLLHSDMLKYGVADTVGKMPDVRGIMRVLACVYHKGWDPVAIIGVQSGRLGHFNEVASFVQANKFNVVTFEPRTFWSMVNNGMDPKNAMKYTVHEDDTGNFLPRINVMTPSDFTIKECAITEKLLMVLKNLTYGSNASASDGDGIANMLTFYLAKSIVGRSHFDGPDIDFIDLQG